MAIFGMYAPAVRDSPSNKYPVNAVNTGCMKSGMHESEADMTKRINYAPFHFRKTWAFETWMHENC